MTPRAQKQARSASRPAGKAAPLVLSPIQRRRRLRAHKIHVGKDDAARKEVPDGAELGNAPKIGKELTATLPKPPKHRIATRRQRTREEIIETRKRMNDIRALVNMKWLEKRGVGSIQRRRLQHDKYMKAWFDFLDADKSGDIGVDELEEPLISLGLAQSRRDAEALIKLYDQDGDMELSYEEFKLLLQGKQKKFRKRIPLKDRKFRKKVVWKNKVSGSTTETRIDAMFDQISSGGLGDDNIPLDMSISNYRRKLLMDANMSPRDDEKRKGLMVLNGILNSRNPTQGALNASPPPDSTAVPFSQQSMFQQLKQRIATGTF
jgi:hypothetical protein